MYREVAPVQRREVAVVGGRILRRVREGPEESLGAGGIAMGW